MNKLTLLSAKHNHISKKELEKYNVDDYFEIIEDYIEYLDSVTEANRNNG